MKKTDLQKENEILIHENKLLKLKLEQEEVYNSIQRYKLEQRIQELESHCDKTTGTHAIGFYIPNSEEE